MTKIQVLKNASLISNLDKKELEEGQILLSEGGQFFPNSYLKELISEIEELEERCGEIEPKVFIPAGIHEFSETLTTENLSKSFTIPSDKKGIFNFQNDEFGLRFIAK